ncbi:MAG: thioesterase family protein [Caldilineaceae bacterium]
MSQESRIAYPFGVEIPTRWMDNDVYGHVNNVHYYSFFDTVIAHYLIHEGGLNFAADPVVGFAIESQCQYRRPITFPERVEARMRVGRIGNSSVRYEIGIFTSGHEEPAAVGYFIHVFVDREHENRPTPIPAQIRQALTRLVIDIDTG